MSALRVPPLVVGTSRPDSLARWASQPPAERVADLIEARLDLAVEPQAPPAPPPDLVPYFAPCRQLQRSGAPVLLTIRLVPDGGRWLDDPGRLPVFQRAFAQGACSWVDIELESDIASLVVEAARATNVRIVISHHDFSGTPDVGVLESLVDRSFRLGADVVKIATRVDGLRDHDHLIELLRRRRDQEIAVVGMGPVGTPLRAYLPCVGSRLTYGFLDGAAAPGQLPAHELVARLQADCPSYAEDRRRRRGGP